MKLLWAIIALIVASLSVPNLVLAQRGAGSAAAGSPLARRGRQSRPALDEATYDRTGWTGRPVLRRSSSQHDQSDNT